MSRERQAHPTVPRFQLGRVAESGVSIAARVKQSPKVPPGWVEGLRRKARKVFGLKKVTDMNPKKSL